MIKATKLQHPARETLLIHFSHLIISVSRIPITILRSSTREQNRVFRGGRSHLNIPTPGWNGSSHISFDHPTGSLQPGTFYPSSMYVLKTWDPLGLTGEAIQCFSENCENLLITISSTQFVTEHMSGTVLNTQYEEADFQATFQAYVTN